MSLDSGEKGLGFRDGSFRFRVQDNNYLEPPQ